jgi:hypothetical protein
MVSRIIISVTFYIETRRMTIGTQIIMIIMIFADYRSLRDMFFQGRRKDAKGCGTAGRHFECDRRESIEKVHWSNYH